MTKKSIVPEKMRSVVDKAGYLPGLLIDNLLVMSGQIGRDDQLRIPENPEQQFQLCWDNLALVLSEAGATFDNVIDITSYHVNMSQHMPLFRKIKDSSFPRATCCWTCIGVSELAHPDLLVEIKCTAYLG